MKNPERIMLSLIKDNAGENILIPRRKIVLTIIVITPTRVKQLLMLSFFLSDLGRYLTNPVPSPRREKEAIKDITEIIVVAIPICAVVNNLAHIIQKTKPNKPITIVLNIR